MTRLRALLLPLVACLAQCATDPTGIYLNVTVEPALSGRINYAVLRVFDGAGMAGGAPVSERAFLIEPGRSYTIFIERTQSRARARVEVDGALATAVGGGRVMLPMAGNLVLPGMGVVSDRALVTYAEDKVLELGLTLRQACVAARCMPEQRCNAAGMCDPYTASNLTVHRW